MIPLFPLFCGCPVPLEFLSRFCGLTYYVLVSTGVEDTWSASPPPLIPPPPPLCCGKGRQNVGSHATTTPLKLTSPSGQRRGKIPLDIVGYVIFFPPRPLSHIGIVVLAIPGRRWLCMVSALPSPLLLKF